MSEEVSELRIRGRAEIFRQIPKLESMEADEFSFVKDWDETMSSHENQPGELTLWVRRSTYFGPNHKIPMVISIAKDLRLYKGRIVLRTTAMRKWHLYGKSVALPFY
jgi:hypothetical protein